MRPRRLAGLLGVLSLLGTTGCSGGDDRAAAGTAPSSTAVATTPTTTEPPATTSTTAPPEAAPAPTTAVPAPTAPPAAEPAAGIDPRIAAVTAEQLPDSWRPGCPVGPDDLRAVTITHLGFDGAEHTGVLVVHAEWAAAVLGVFDQLRAIGYPVERIEPVDAYGGSDDASMAANNTSAFNCRAVTGGTGWSRHAYGTAIDLNPRQNPYVTDGGATVLPPEGAAYVDRHPEPGVINRGDGVVEAFAAIGWRWGGDWADPVDYQHFDIRP